MFNEPDFTPPTPPPLESTTPPTPPEKPHKKSDTKRGCLIGCLITCVIFLGFVILACILAGIAIMQAIGSGFADDDETEFTRDASGLEEVWSDNYKIDPAPLGEPLHAMRISLRGTIDLSSSDPSFLRSGNSSALALRAIRRATQDDEVDAIFLEVDSGGGGITASDILYHELLKFKATSKGRKIVVLMGDIAASGAYYVSLAADRIIAHPTTITGSIGVILPSYNIQELTNAIGIQDNSITSGPNKAILSPMRELTPEQRNLLQGTVDELYDRFVGLVSLHRNIPLPTAKSIADGRLYTAQQAQKLHLIDSIGYFEDAQQALYEELGSPVNGISFYTYQKHTSFRDLMSSPDFWGQALSHAIPKATANLLSETQLRPQAK